MNSALAKIPGLGKSDKKLLSVLLAPGKPQEKITDPRLVAVDELLDDVVLDKQLVLESLREDVNKIFSKPMRFDVFAEDFTIYDHTGEKIEGLRAGKRVFYLLSKMRKWFVMRGSQCEIDESQTDDFRVLWGVFFRYRQPPPQRRQHAKPVRNKKRWHAKADLVFTFNEKNEVNSMQINEWTVNGTAIEEWPDCLVYGSLVDNMMAIRSWAQRMSWIIHEHNLPEETPRMLPVRRVMGRRLDEPEWTLYDSISEASRMCDIPRNYIGLCCRGEMKKVWNHEFKYVFGDEDEYVEEDPEMLWRMQPPRKDYR